MSGLSVAPRYAPLETLPQELIEEILEHVPAERADDRVLSLAHTSRTLYDKAIGKTLSKLSKQKSAQFVSDANFIGWYRPMEGRFAEFKRILEWAKGNKSWLSRCDLSDVFLALMDQIDMLNGREMEGFELMLELAEGERRQPDQVAVGDQNECQPEPVEVDDHTKAAIIHRLSGVQAFRAFYGDRMAVFFDRLCSAVENIHEPKAKDRVFSQMVLIHWCSHFPERVGAAGYRRLVNLVESKANELSDYPKADAVSRLVRELAGC